MNPRSKHYRYFSTTRGADLDSVYFVPGFDSASSVNGARNSSGVLCTLVDDGASVFRPNSERSMAYAGVQEAISKLSSLPVGHSLHVDGSAAQRASDFLAVMGHNFDLDVPKVMAQDSETVVFTWDHGSLKRYMTVDDDGFALMDLQKKTGVRCMHAIEADEDLFQNLVLALNAPLKSSTVADADA